MLLLKVFIKNELTFLQPNAKDEIIINGKKLFTNANGSLYFFKKNNKWYIKNNTTTRLKYRLFGIKPDKCKKLKLGKPIICGKESITQIKNIKGYRKSKHITVGGVNSSCDLTKKTEHIIGSDDSCDIVIKNPQIDRKNTRIIYDNDKCYIEDLNSSNGLIINDRHVKRKVLEDYDIIELPSVFFTYCDNKLIYSVSDEGIRIDVVNLSKKVRDTHSKKMVTLLHDLNFTVKESEFVAIVGGSGAGKSTTLDAINGLRPASEGNVYYDYNDYYELKHCYQKIIGYVPQKDIMHDELSVIKSLYYYAQIRMQHQLSKKEILALCEKAIDDVCLSDKKNLKISSLSGGQKKRVSIAMELLSNPRVIFLDEPTSGLSPDLDFEIMDLLKKLSREQKRTIVIITHNMENIDMCDKILFLGNGGKMCYYGTPSKLFSFFKVKKCGQIFSLLSSPIEVERYAYKLLVDLDYKAMIKERNKIFKEGI